MKNILFILYYIIYSCTPAFGAATTTITADQIRSSNRTKMWTPPSITDVLTGLTDVQTLTNKTLTSPTINTPLVDVDTFTEQGSTPATPAAGKRKVYAKSDGIYHLDSAGNERRVGSGSGGGLGVNIIDNKGFESGINAGWTSSGGTYTAITTAPNLIYETLSASFQASAIGQYFETSSLVIPKLLYGQSCMAKISYTGGDDKLFLTALDGAGVSVVGNVKAVLNSTSGTKEAKLYFTCPSSGSLKLRVESTAASASAIFDEAHIGSADGQPVKQAQFVGSVNFSSCGAGTFSTTSATPVDVTFGVCTTTIKGDIAAATGNLFGVTISNVRAGTYFVKVTASTRSNGGSTTSSVVTDGSTSLSAYTSGVPSGDTYGGTIDGVFTYAADQGSKTFKYQIFKSGSGTVYAEAGASAQISVFFFPSGNDVVVNARCENDLKCADKFIAVMNGTSGAYSSENIVGWLTAYSKPTTGTYTYTISNSVLTTSAFICDAQVINNPSGGNVPIDANITYTSNTITVYTKQAGAFVDVNFSLKCDKAGNNYQPKKEMTGFFSGYAKSPDNLRIEKARVVGSGGEGTNCTASPCTMLRASSGISSVTRSSTGDYVINFVGGTFSEPPSCSYAVSNSASPVVPVELQLPTSADVGIAMRTTGGAGTDSRFDITCVGR